MDDCEMRKWCFDLEAIGPFATIDEMKALLVRAPAKTHPAAIGLDAVIKDREFQAQIAALSNC